MLHDSFCVRSQSAADYLSLLDWTARQQRAGKQGLTPKHVAPLFERLGISVDTWSRLVKDFDRLFSVVVGQPQRIDEHHSKKNSRRYHARRETRDLLAKTLSNHEPQLPKWFESQGLSSDVVEGLNKAKLTMRKAYGFKEFNTIETAIFHQLGHLPEPKSTHRFC